MREQYANFSFEFLKSFANCPAPSGIYDFLMFGALSNVSFFETVLIISSLFSSKADFS